MVQNIIMVSKLSIMKLVEFGNLKKAVTYWGISNHQARAHTSKYLEEYDSFKINQIPFILHIVLPESTMKSPLLKKRRWRRWRRRESGGGEE